MTKRDAGKVVRAGLLELMPVRTCAGCEKHFPLPGHEVLFRLSDVGAVLLFFCSERCDTPWARVSALATLKVTMVERLGTMAAPKAEA